MAVGADESPTHPKNIEALAIQEDPLESTCQESNNLNVQTQAVDGAMSVCLIASKTTCMSITNDDIACHDASA